MTREEKIVVIALYIILLIAGFAALIKGADFFVDGSSALAERFGVSKIIIGLTIVAMGTSAPELAVSVSAAIQGANEIALSNVVGSNLFNLLVVLGICAIFHPVPVDKIMLKRDIPISIGLSVIVLFLSSAKVFTDKNVLFGEMSSQVGNAGRVMGIILLVMFLTYIAYLVYDAKKRPEKRNEKAKSPMWKCLLFIILGLGMIIGGGQAVVYGAKGIAYSFGMSETLVGLTIVAIGTSLPELVTSAVAAKKGETGLAVGNVIGSNIFNILFILGASSAIHPIAVNLASVYDMIILIVISVFVYVFSLTGKKINRAEGISMVLLYVADVVFAVLR